VNLGRLGFLTSCQSEDFEAALRNLASGDYVAQPRMALSARVIDQTGQARKQWRALNDFVLHKGGFARVVRLNVFVDDESIGTYAADGIVISTPTGSTAYSLSAGGPVVVPTLESIVLTPISPHTLAIRSLVIPADAEVTVEANESPTELLVTVDGQVGTSFVKGEKLKIRKADSPVRIVRFPGATFFERMRVKLGWGGLPDVDKA
jgi:NAD+ kinase